MNTRAISPGLRKRIKRAWRNYQRRRAHNHHPFGPARRRADRARVAFAKAWNDAAQSTDVRQMPMISGLTLLPYDRAPAEATS